MRLLALLLVCACVLPLTAQVPVGDFECQTAGSTLPMGFPDCEGWSTVSGAPYVVAGPFTGPAGLPLPTSGLQMLEVGSGGFGPASPVVNPATGGTYPFVVGTVAEAQCLTAVPVFPSGNAALTFDWYFTTNETQGGSAGGFNDFAQIALIDPITGNLMQTLLYVDTYAPYTVQNGNTVPSFGGVTAANYVQGVTTTTVVINPNLIGQPIIISIVAANQGDGSFDSGIFVDQVTFTDPGSLFGFTLQTSGGGVGDLNFGVQGVPGAASDVLILLSATPAIAGVGTGIGFGLEPDALFLTTLFTPNVPGGLTHFPTAASPFAAGNLAYPAGSVSGLAGQIWEGVAIAYSPLTGFFQLSNHAQAAF